MRSNRRNRLALIPIGIAISIFLAGCTQAQLNGFLPGSGEVTNHTSRIVGLWTTSWFILMLVGILTWGLIIWAAIVYRRRKGQTGLPAQLRYNLPIEVFYTIVPFILIIGFFSFTARDQAIIEAPHEEPDVTIEVIGKRWAWDFNYLTDDVYFQGVQARETRENNTIDPDSLPTLYLPVDKKVELKIESRDVAHSFWVVDFLYKKDMLPGKSNYMYFIPLETGTFAGKCAELCGEYHSLMLFNVKIVEQDEYDAQMAALRAAGNTGAVGGEYDANTNLPGTANQRGEQ